MALMFWVPAAQWGEQCGREQATDEAGQGQAAREVPCLCEPRDVWVVVSDLYSDVKKLDFENASFYDRRNSPSLKKNLTVCRGKP